MRDGIVDPTAQKALEDLAEKLEQEAERIDAEIRLARERSTSDRKAS
jgi:hypothetical protein